MSIITLTIILMFFMLLFLALGVPVVFALGGLGLSLTLILWGWEPTRLVAFAAVEQWTSFVLVAAPLFVFMGSLFQYSGIADEVYETMYRWAGPLKGGLAMGTVFICTIFGAIVGISGASTITMGLIAIPSMLSRGYGKTIALGSVGAGGLLGILIPPSIIMILYSSVSGESVGKMFIGGIVPGLILSGLYITYIGIRCSINPSLGPPLPLEMRYSWEQKFSSLKTIVFPFFMVLSVLGTIYLGVATPTEAGAIGSAGALTCMVLKRKFSWKAIRSACEQTFRLHGMILWLLLGANLFNKLYVAMGAKQLIMKAVLGFGLGPHSTILIFMGFIFLFGMMVDDFALVMICTPLFVPIVKALGLNTFWFAILFMVNMQCAYLTPPYGMNLFYLRTIAPKGVSMGDIYRSIIPFVLLQVVCLIIIFLFPGLVLWLPSKMVR